MLLLLLFSLLRSCQTGTHVTPSCSLTTMVMCTHVNRAVRITGVDVNRIKTACVAQQHAHCIDVDAPAGIDSTWSSCGTGRSLWLCLTCSLVHCGRYVNQDSLKHSRTTNHCLTVEVDEHRVYCYICEDFVVNDTIDGKIASVTQSLGRYKSLRAGDHAYAILAEPFGVPQSIYYAASGSVCSSIADHHVTYRTTTTVNHQTLTLSRTHYWRQQQQQQQHHHQQPTHYVSGRLGGNHYATLRNTPSHGHIKSGQITVSEHLRLARMNQQKQQQQQMAAAAASRKRLHADTAATSSAVLAPIKLCKVVRWVRPQCSTSPTTSNSSSGVESMCSTRHGSTSPPHLSPVDFAPLVAGVTQLRPPPSTMQTLQSLTSNRVASAPALVSVHSAPAQLNAIDTDDVDDDNSDEKQAETLPTATKLSRRRPPVTHRRRRTRTSNALSVRKTPSSQSLSSTKSARSTTTATSAISKAPAAPLPRGMCNLGNTCYVNCVVQALRSLPKIDMNLTVALANAQRRKTDDPQAPLTPFCVALSDTLTALATPGTPPFTPKALISTIDSLFPQFSGSKMQQDAHDLLHAILNRMYEESSGARSVSRSRRQTASVSDEFRFQVQSKVTCKHCNRVSAADETYTDLSLELPTGVSDLESVSLTDCLRQFFSAEHMDDASNKYACRACGDMRPCVKCLCMTGMPGTLVLHLKRYDRQGNKLNRFVDYPMHGLNMKDFAQLPSPLPPALTTIYDLTALVVHTGKSHSRGHYQTFGRRNDNWYLFDDRRVSAVAESTVAAQRAYVLFYTQRHGVASPYSLRGRTLSCVDSSDDGIHSDGTSSTS